MNLVIQICLNLQQVFQQRNSNLFSSVQLKWLNYLLLLSKSGFLQLYIYVFKQHLFMYSRMQGYMHQCTIPANDLNEIIFELGKNIFNIFLKVINITVPCPRFDSDLLKKNLMNYICFGLESTGLLMMNQDFRINAINFNF